MPVFMSTVTRSRFNRLLSLVIVTGAAWLVAPDAAIAERAGEAPAKTAPKQEEKSSLVVEVTHLRNGKGRVAIAVFASEKAFPEQSRALQGKLAKIKRGRARVTFQGLKPGTYAVAVLHDENQNDKMDFNLLGMPLEGYGFSNDASAMFGPPSFEDASFRVSGKTTSKIKTRYFSL